jgi:hypothetical protein
MNFYLPPLSVFGQELSRRGFHSFVINTPRHDWISRCGKLTKFGGSAYEASRGLPARSRRRIGISPEARLPPLRVIGHSLGAIKFDHLPR